MSISSVLSHATRNGSQQTSSLGFVAPTVFGLIALLFALPMAWSQTAPYFGPTSGQALSGTSANLTTSAGVTEFNNQILIVWCGYGGYIQTAFLTSVSAEPTTIYTSTIACSENESGAGRITVATFTPTGGQPTVYAMGQALNNGTYNDFPIISSTDGIHWTSTLANVTYDGHQDSTFDQGFGLYAFQPTVNGPTYLYLAYISSFVAGEGFSVAQSSDGKNFAWQGLTASYALYSEPETWAQSPAIFWWQTIQGGTNDLYVSYLTTGGHVVVAHSANGVTWSSEETSSTLNRDVMLVTHGDALYFGGQSSDGNKNLWMAGSFDGVTWPATSNYNSIMRTSPSAISFNGDFFDVIVAEANSKLWSNWVD